MTERKNGARPLSGPEVAHKAMYLLIARFIDARPSLAASNLDVLQMLEHMLKEVTEAEEAYHEAQKSGLEAQDLTSVARLHRKELVDVLFFIVSSAHLMRVPLNYHVIQQKLELHLVFRRTAKSGIYDMMRSIVHDLQTQVIVSPERQVEHLQDGYQKLIALLYADILWQEMHIAPQVVLAMVLEKNKSNYPAEYFAGINPDGSPLSSEEKKAQYHHAVACLKLIRAYTGNNPHGLATHDHRPFAHLIMDWRHSEWAYARLQHLLKQEKQSEKLLTQ